MEWDTEDIDIQLLEKMIYKHLTPALQARAGLLCTFRRRHKSPSCIRQANAALRMIQKGEA